MSKHPLTQAMGLSVYKNPNGSDWVSADELERVLEQAPVVYGTQVGRAFHVPDPRLGLKSGTSTPDTHTARLLCIQPIKALDTAESLLREYLDTFGQVQGSPVNQWADRARKLLERK